ncbi:uncharacterized protein SCHCODRAFT_01282369 [Schizophyllum commune H4-8]|uniref:uncharacterized protein n=1 Tax=Schizophyllum commune (strain H4-8 / FGSC 9210) TaxID=578458 RepID=UPI00215FDB3D|nr:uncharacterized protein SCHCODRAFT_01282369 [Schizophyllum commune H4-8]KAI5895096.1 hypothetical protein SCHCODRAFT_01282369 [Schizophyllum commune H4-8]
MEPVPLRARSRRHVRLSQRRLTVATLSKPSPASPFLSRSSLAFLCCVRFFVRRALPPDGLTAVLGTVFPWLPLSFPCLPTHLSPRPHPHHVLLRPIMAPSSYGLAHFTYGLATHPSHGAPFMPYFRILTYLSIVPPLLFPRSNPSRTLPHGHGFLCRVTSTVPHGHIYSIVHYSTYTHTAPLRLRTITSSTTHRASLLLVTFLGIRIKPIID